MGEAVNNAGTAMQLIPGPAGKVVGGAIFAASAMSSAAKAFHGMGPEIRKEAERLKAQAQASTDALGKYGKAFSDYTDLIRSGSTDIKLVRDAQQKMAEAMREVPPQVRAQIQSDRNLTEVQQKIAEAQSQMQSRNVQAQQGAAVAERFEAELGFADLFGRDFGKRIGGQEDILEEY